MNSTAPPKRGPLALKRIAAATAGVVAAALLIPPGTASAQEEVDCSTLGDNPIDGGIESAFRSAAACDVEVRISTRALPYSTVYAMPDGRLHIVATTDPVQEYRDYGVLDPALQEWEGALGTVSLWPFELRYTDAARPLVSTANVSLDWSGETPVPTYSGTTAVYDELATGLDLTVDMGLSSANLAFTVADATAWSALATGLSAEGPENLTADGGMLYFTGEADSPNQTLDRTTPFTVRDAAGAVTPVELVLADSGALTLSLPDGALESAAFPLTVYTQWNQHDYSVNHWGSVTSASPDLTLYRGKAGLDEPYFEAAGESGDAIVGAYCDDLVDPACSATATAATYWEFQWPYLDGRLPDYDYTFEYPISSATFSVDSAEGTDCVAPELNLTSAYTTGSTWSDRPDPTGAAGAGACQDGSAVYDVTASIDAAWSGSGDHLPVTFGMTDSAQTARFDGGSARLDVYLHVVGYTYWDFGDDVCEPSGAEAPFSFNGTPDYAEFEVDLWEPELTDSAMTWTATFYNADTGETVLTTEASELVSGEINTRRLDEADALPSGRYEVVHEITSTTSGFSYTSEPCYLGVDTVDPEVVDITVVDPGPYHVGDVVTVDVTVADEGYPDGWRSLTVFCAGSSDCVGEDTVVLTEGTSASFEVRLNGTRYNNPAIFVEDESGRTGFGLGDPLPAPYPHRDYDGDGHQDLLAVRKSDGNLVFYAGRGDGTFESAVSNGSGWGGMDIVMSGDLTGDGLPDLLARDTKSGHLYTYEGDGAGAFLYRDRIDVGPGWNAMGPFTSAGDFDKDGNLDLLAVRKADGGLYLYPGRGDGTFDGRTLVDTGWGSFDLITTVGDLDGDLRYDVVARSGWSGEYYTHHGQSDASFLTYGYPAPPSLGDESEATRYSQVVGAGDIDEDGYEDVVAVDSRTGELVRHSLDINGDPSHPGEVVGSDWDAFRLPVAAIDRTYHYNGDIDTDVIALRESDGNLYFYPGDGEGNLGSRSSIGPGWNAMDLVTTAGDVDGDGFADLLARDASSGRLYLYPGDGRGGHGDRIDIGGGWDAMSAIVGGHDYDGDGRVDIIARQASNGHLYVYPGDGSGGLGDRVDIGWGWNAMREVTAVGDLDHDGHADLIAVRESNGCLYFYGGRGDGTFARSEIGCGWNAMDALAGVGDFDGDGHVDWLARRISDGDLFFYPGDGDGNHGSRGYIGWGWNSMSEIA